ncbi:MAG TPA: ribbon-helix-helix protein, CopG family [Bryobacteraceae bacterium]|jgi:predicted DNA-binding protein
MATTKVTFTLDADTINRLERASERLSKPKSQVIREAVQEYYDRIGRLSESERLRMLRVLDEIMARPPSRPAKEVDRELREIRRARRSGGRRTPVE